MAKTIHVRGEGGQVIAMDTPLPEPIAERLTKGLLRRVNADGSPYTCLQPSAAAADGEQDTEAAAATLTEQGRARPAANARKAEWVGWAVHVHGMDPEDAEEMTKADLMELPELPSEQTPDAPPAGGNGRPAEDADKSEWIAYVVRRGLLSAKDAANYTRDDLIDLAT